MSNNEVWCSDQCQTMTVDRLHQTFQLHAYYCAKAVPHCFDVTNTIWQNQVPVIFLMRMEETFSNKLSTIQ